MLSQQNLAGSSSSAATYYGATFKIYVSFQTRQGSINTFTEFKNMFTVILTDIAWNWFEPNMNNKQNMPNLKKKFLN